jgi:aryl-alcohol dehydrogenase-like predicted oxidoreductase
MTAMMAARATGDGTARYAARFAARAVPPEHFRELGSLRVSSIGIGTYLGPEDDATDTQYRTAMARAVDRGVNVIDAAVNYRHQRSERAVGRALVELVGRGVLARDEIIVATKGGFIPLDAAVERETRAYFTETYLTPGIIHPDDVVGGMHCMAPRYLESQIERSRQNLGLDTIDLYYVHNPETQLDEVDRAEFRRRMQDAFAALERAVGAGTIARYGVATWSGLRQDPGTKDYLSLAELVELAREAGGAGHHFSAIQLPYNLAMPEAFTRANQAVEGETVPVLEAARRLGLYVMASASVYQGQLTRNLPPTVGEYLPGLETDAQRALQFVRSTPGIGTALVGMKSTAHVEENSLVARTAPVPWAEFKRLFTEA